MDRLTQLQECVDKLSEMFYTSIGVLQRNSPLMETSEDKPVTLWPKEQLDTLWTGNKELAKTVAKDIIETSKTIDFLIDQLPGVSQSQDEQEEYLKQLEEENRLTGIQLEAAIHEAETYLDRLKPRIKNVVTNQLKFE